MIKAVKKLKRIWSRKKRRKKTREHQPHYYYPAPPSPPPPPSPRHYCTCCSSSTQPSAPPLPLSWSEIEQVPETFSPPAFSCPSHIQFPHQPQQFAAEPAQLPESLPLGASSSGYQQYMAPADPTPPAYGVPVQQTSLRRREFSLFGCVIGFASNLIRCFFPCFRIREGYR